MCDTYGCGLGVSRRMCTYLKVCAGVVEGECT